MTILKNYWSEKEAIVTNPAKFTDRSFLANFKPRFFLNENRKKQSFFCAFSGNFVSFSKPFVFLAWKAFLKREIKWEKKNFVDEKGKRKRKMMWF